MSLWLLAILRCNVSPLPLWNQILCSQFISWKRTCGVQYRWGASRGIPHTYTPSPIPLSDLQPVREDHAEVLRGSVISLSILMVKVMKVLRNSFFHSDVDGYAVTRICLIVFSNKWSFLLRPTEKVNLRNVPIWSIKIWLVTKVADNIVITSELLPLISPFPRFSRESFGPTYIYEVKSKYLFDIVWVCGLIEAAMGWGRRLLLTATSALVCNTNHPGGLAVVLMIMMMGYHDGDDDGNNDNDTYL